jgi:hypothetical protein
MTPPRLRRSEIVLIGIAVLFLLLALTADAMAAGGGEQVGERVGDLLGSWARSLYVGVAAVVALIFLMGRRFADLGVFMLAALLVGGFVMAPGEVAGVVRDIWRTITG